MPPQSARIIVKERERYRRGTHERRFHATKSMGLIGRSEARVKSIGMQMQVVSRIVAGADALIFDGTSAFAATPVFAGQAISDSLAAGPAELSVVYGNAMNPVVKASEVQGAFSFTQSEVTLPLSYVTQRRSLIVFSVNGAPLADSVGGSNQLWLGSTSARYFARDIVSISFEARAEDDVPCAPGAVGEMANESVPNVAVCSYDS